jgi:hypothetical protein
MTTIVSGSTSAGGAAPISAHARRAASDCSAAKRKCARGSRAITNRTTPLQRLQTPSKRMMVDDRAIG